MKKKFIYILLLCVLFVFLGIVIMVSNKVDETANLVPVLEALEEIENDIQVLKNGRYDNLVAKDFETNMHGIESIYNIDILTNHEYLQRTFIENFDIMNQAIDKFFVEDFDKSYVEAEIQVSRNEDIYVSYNDILTVCEDDKYNNEYLDYLFGNNTSNGGYMIQTSESLQNTWFSRNEFGTILPSENGCKKQLVYLSGQYCDEDEVINFRDGEVLLSVMEAKVIDFLNSEQFPLPKSQGITYQIGEVRILDNGFEEAICFKVRRVYKGVPFEYGATSSSDIYLDTLPHDRGEICYASSEYPDTLVGFGRVNGTVVETKQMKEIISLSEALRLVSNKIGDNSIYDVCGIELVYREVELSKEEMLELDGRLEPKWKIITINQNDDKYTLFYVDVVTGEITNRFEYYYD